MSHLQVSIIGIFCFKALHVADKMEFVNMKKIRYTDLGSAQSANEGGIVTGEVSEPLNISIPTPAKLFSSACKLVKKLLGDKAGCTLSLDLKADRTSVSGALSVSENQCTKDTAFWTGSTKVNFKNTCIVGEFSIELFRQQISSWVSGNASISATSLAVNQKYDTTLILGSSTVTTCFEAFNILYCSTPLALYNGGSVSGPTFVMPSSIENL